MTDNSKYGLYIGGRYKQDGTLYQTVAKYNTKENTFDEITGGLKNGSSAASICLLSLIFSNSSKNNIPFLYFILVKHLTISPGLEPT